jgi:hypothetical protein
MLLLFNLIEQVFTDPTNKIEIHPFSCIQIVVNSILSMKWFTVYTIVDGKSSFNVSTGLASVQVTYALLHLREIPRFVNPRSKGIAST